MRTCQSSSGTNAHIHDYDHYRYAGQLHQLVAVPCTLSVPLNKFSLLGVLCLCVPELLQMYNFNYIAYKI